MKVRLPKHREFVINMDENDPNYNECWNKLNQILVDYQRNEGKNIYDEHFIEDNEHKVQALQEEYKFTYTIEMVD